MINSFLILIIFAFSLASAADLPTLPASRNSSSMLPIPTFQEEVTKPRDLIVQTPVNLEAPIDSNYIIGPGDFFEILLPSGNEGLQVSPEGTIAINGFGLINVNELKLFEAKQKIIEKLKTRYDHRFIGIHLVQLRKFIVNVQGAVTRPGQVIVSGQARVKEAVYSAGSLKSMANKDSVYIYRNGDTLITAENIFLQVGDIIEVPYKEWRETIELMYTGKTITVPYIPKRTIKEYAKDAGINLNQKFNDVRIWFPEDNFTKWININQIDLFSPEPSCKIEFYIQAPFVYVGGAVASIGKVPYNPEMHAVDYVAASGVTIITGNFSRISVLRGGKKISVDWATGEILPGDFIDIPRTGYEITKDIVYFVTSLLTVVMSAIVIAGR